MFRCGSLEQTTSRKSSFTCSFLFLMFCKSLVERRHGQLYHPAIYLSFPLRLSFALSLLLSALPNHCLYSCLSPLQQKPLSRESQTHAFTHEHIHFPPRVKHGAKGHTVSSLQTSLQWKHLFFQKISKLYHNGPNWLSPAIKL